MRAELCGATVEGVEVGSRTFEFVLGSNIRGGTFAWDSAAGKVADVHGIALSSHLAE